MQSKFDLFTENGNFHILVNQRELKQTKFFAFLHPDTEDCCKREKFAVSQQILADDQMRAERNRMVEREKAKFFQMGNSEESGKEESEIPDSVNDVQETINSSNSQDSKLQTAEPNSEPLSKLASCSFMIS